MPNWFKIIGRLEGISFLLLLGVAMPLKYAAGMPKLVQLLGPAHGFLFLGYCAGLLWLSINQEWPLKKQLLGFAAAVFPFGTFMFEKKYSDVATASR